MRIDFNKTIEEMAREGYQPVLDPGIAAIKVSEQVDLQKLIESLPDYISNMYRKSHPRNPIVAQIEVVVLKLNIKGYDKDGKVIDPKAPTTPINEDSTKAYIPFLAYVKAPD